MNKYNDPFLAILPSLDVHGEFEDTVMTYVGSFIEEQYKLGNKKIVVVHGKGAGILKNKIHESLRKNRLVSRYYLYNFNIGCTIIELI